MQKVRIDYQLISIAQRVKNGFLKADTELDVYQFSDLLISIFNVTGWVSQHGMLIKCFAKHDLSIEQLANKINELKQEDAGNN